MSKIHAPNLTLKRLTSDERAQLDATLSNLCQAHGVSRPDELPESARLEAVHGAIAAFSKARSAAAAAVERENVAPVEDVKTFVWSSGRTVRGRR